MWPFNKTSESPDFGFKVEVVQQLENGNTVYAGYGLRVVEMKNERGKKVFQLRVKDNLLLDWSLLGTYRRTSEVRSKLSELAVSTDRKPFNF